MYPVSELYKNKIQENSRTFKTIIEIQHSQGVLFLSDRDLALGTLVYTESSQAGEDFTIGSTVASNISFTILNKPEYDNINFSDARVTVTISLLIREGADAHFLQPSQPSKTLNSGDVWEDVPLGRFNIDDVKRLRNTIELKAIDDMVNLDKPYSLSKLSYPANLYQIYLNICNVADVNIGTFDFPNKDYIVNTKPSGELTLRDVLGYIAELNGAFAKFNRNGGLELKWYTPTGLELGPSNRFNFKPSDDEVRIKGVMATVDDTTYLSGSEDYAIDLTDNPLLQGEYQTVLPNIFNNVKDTTFIPYTSDWQGNPAIQAGDIITQIDKEGKIYNTLVTKSVYKYRGRSQLEAKGLPEISKGFKGSTDKRLLLIKKKTEDMESKIGDKLTTLEQAQLNAMELMTNMLGGNLIIDYENGIFYVADNPNISQATEIWKWGLGGFGYSKDGGVTWDTTITADGSIVAMLVAANIITANMVRTGLLQSEDNSTWIDLDDGTFNFKNVLKFIDDKLSLNSTFGDGLMEISDNKGFVAYKDATKKEFTQLYPSGLYRVIMDGTTEKRKEYFYEREVLIVGDYTQKSYDGAIGEATIKNDMNVLHTVQLPSNMIGKNFKILSDVFMGDGEYMNKFADAFRYSPVASVVKTKVEIQSMSGQVWDGYTQSTMPASIKNTGQFRILAYYYYVYSEGVYPNRKTYTVAFSIKAKVDVIA